MAGHDPIGCVQAENIGSLKATTDNINKTLEKLSSVLEHIAAQSTRIEKLEKDCDEVFTRLRGVEITSNTHEVRMGVVATFISMIVGSLSAYIVKHFGGH